METVLRNSVMQTAGSTAGPSDFTQIALVAGYLKPITSTIVCKELVSITFRRRDSVFTFSTTSFGHYGTDKSFFGFAFYSFLGSSAGCSVGTLSGSSPPEGMSPLISGASVY